MLYMMLLYSDHEEWEGLSEEKMAGVMRDHRELAADLRKTGRFQSCNALESTRAATTIRVRSGKTLVTDGPFAETKEQLGGYYLVEAKNLDDAIAIASRIPDARVGAVEVRPVRIFDS